MNFVSIQLKKETQGLLLEGELRQKTKIEDDRGQSIQDRGWRMEDEDEDQNEDENEYEDEDEDEDDQLKCITD